MRLSILFSFFLFLHACTNNSNPEETTLVSASATDQLQLSPAQMALAEVELGLPRRQSLSQSLECMAVVAAAPGAELRVHSPVQGFVHQLPSRLPGDLVRKGSLLLELTHPDFARTQRELLETQSQLLYLENDWKRKQALAAGDAASERVLQEATAAFQLAQARFQGLSAELEMIGFSVKTILKNGVVQRTLPLYAPATGVLTAIDVQPGQLISPQELLFTLLDQQKLLLEIQVFSKDLPSLKPGQKMEVRLPGIDQDFQATLKQVGAAVNEADRSAIAYAQFDAGVQIPALGSFVQVAIQTDAREALVVPQSAIAREGALSYIFVKEGQQFRRVQVQTGRVQDDLVELLEFDLQDSLVTKGAYYLNGSMMEAE